MQNKTYLWGHELPLSTESTIIRAIYTCCTITWKGVPVLLTQQAFTLEADDVDAAVAEILEQLNLDELKANSLGLVSALPAFVESGVVAALQEALPFELVGQTSIATSASGSDDMDQLSLLVLTADDVEFSLSLSSPITGETSEPLSTAYSQATEGHTERPQFILGYVPLLLTASGDFFVESISKASGGVPFFAALAVDDTMDYHTSQVIYKGQGYRDQMAFVLFYGNVQPHFYMAGITHGRVFDKTGVVTSSAGSQLKTINDAPVSEFLVSLGINPNEEGEFVGINSFPYIVDYNDGTDPVIRVMFAVTPEGSAVCGGDIPEGATLAVSYFDTDEIMDSSSACIKQIAADIEAEGRQAVLAFSCIGRYFTLSFEPDAEARLLHEALDTKGIPYTFTYCGGEICPVPGTEGSKELTNRAHNSTFIAVTL